MTSITQQTEHVTNRVQFGSKLQEYGSVQEKVARMTVLQYVTEVCGLSVMVPSHTILNNSPWPT